jgi:protein tyrosine phosphatase
MIQAYRTEAKDQSQPVLVHCSAGIGRTGTVIAIDHAMQLLHHNNVVNLLDVVRLLRKGRCAMIQHTQQYEFFHAACVHYAKIKNHPLTLVCLSLVCVY